MFNISIVLIEIKQGSAVLFERFFANLWSNQSFWLQRYPIYNNLFGVFSIDPTAGIKAPISPGKPVFIRPLTKLVALGRKHLSKINNHCLSIAIIRRYQLIKVISIMKNTGPLWITFIRREFILKILESCHRGFVNAKLPRPKM